MNESLEILTSRFVGCFEAERGSIWTAGDIVNAAIDDIRRQAANPRELRRRRSALFKHFASNAGKSCTTAFVRQRSEVSGCFGTEQRYPDVSFSFFRAVMNAARRTNRDARELLDDALAKALTVGDLGALGREEAEEAALTDECGDCGAAVSVKLRKQGIRVGMVGLVLPCPCCVAIALRDNRDAREVKALGALA